MDKIAAALVKAQKAFGPALKSSSNSHFKSKYADLSACVEAVIDGLNANGIALIQKQHPHDGGVSVETIFLHESGELFSAGVLNVPAQKNDAQGYGSALTYARRYSLMAACGIAPEDDDGNAASPKREPVKAFKKSHSPTTIAFDNLPASLKDYLTDEAPKVEKVFSDYGAQDASGYIDEMQLDEDGRAGLFHLLSSKTRSAIDGLTKGKM